MTTFVCVCGCLHVCVHTGGPSGLRLPPDGHRQGLGGAGTGADDVGSQAFGLKDVEEGVAGGDGP